MRREDLNDALERNSTVSWLTRERYMALDRSIGKRRQRRQELETRPHPDLVEEYATNDRVLYAELCERVEANARLALHEEFEQAVTGLKHGWQAAMPGRHTGRPHFFVRSFAIADGKPTAYDPFWIEACAEFLKGTERLRSMHADWLARNAAWEAALKPVPPFPVLTPFGGEAEAVRRACACGREGYVIGCKDLPYPTQTSRRTYRQALYVLCLACPRLTLLAERHDAGLIQLHP